MAMGNAVLEGNALELLSSIPTGSVSHVVTDPPYGQTNESYDDDVAFRPDAWRECFRVCGADAALLSFAGSPTYHRIASAIELGGWKVRQMWAWVFSDGMITSAYPKEGFDRLAPAMTPIVFATKGKVLLPLQREGGGWEVRFGQNEKHSPFSERSLDRAKTVRHAAGHWPRSVVCTDGVQGFQYFALAHNAVGRNRSGHPNEKPMPLMRWLCGKLPPGVVLDPFAGSGTTLEAALLEGHPRVIGIEREPAYCRMIRDRLADVDRLPWQKRPAGPDPAGVASVRQISLFD